MSDTSPLTGRCYCGAVRYAAAGRPIFKAQCHCRECQYFSGGGPNYFMLMPEQDFAWTGDAPAAFTHPDPENAVTRKFCGTCGTHMTTHLPGRDHLVLKVGTLDDPARFGGPVAAIHAVDKQPFHLFPDGAPVFEKLPPQ